MTTVYGSCIQSYTMRVDTLRPYTTIVMFDLSIILFIVAYFCIYSKPYAYCKVYS
jgi:hypothetical protein